jgi:hypothetical protein
MTSISQTDRQLADTRIWIKSLANIDPSEMSPEDFQQWVIGQLKNELGPLMEASALANQAEVRAVYEHVGELDVVVNELMDHEESYLRAEVSADLVKTLMLGMQVCQSIVNFDPDDELGKRKLGEAIQEYTQMATVMLDTIEQITEGEEEDDDDESERSELSVESPDPGGVDGRGEGASGEGGGTSDADEEARDGSE